MGNKDLSFVTEAKAYTASRPDGNLLEFSFNKKGAETKRFKCPVGSISEVATDKEHIYVSSYENESKGTPISRIWEFRIEYFKDIFILNGIIKTMTLSLDKKSLFGVLSKIEGSEGPFLFKVKIGPKTKVITPEELVKARGFESIKIDKRGWIFVLAKEGDVDVYDQDLVFRYSVNPNLKATRIAITSHPSYLYVSGKCKNDTSKYCINRLALE